MAERSRLAVVDDVLSPGEGAATEPLADRLGLAVVAGVLPILLTSLLVATYVGVTGVAGDVPRAVVDTAYGLAAVAVLGGVYATLGADERAAMLRLEVPGRRELAWTLGGLPLAIGAFLLGSRVGEALGLSMAGFGYSLADPATLAAVLLSGVLIAPVVEEVLFRGLLLGSLLGRGVPPAVAGLLSVALFAGVHVIALGGAGVLAIAAWAIVPTVLRLRFDNLAGAWLLHALNNVYSYLIVVALGLA